MGEGGRLKAFPLRNKTRTSCPSCPHIKDLGTAVRIEKDIQDIQIENTEVRGSLLADTIVLFLFKGRLMQQNF